MSNEFSQVPKDSLKKEDFEVSLEYEHTEDVEERLTKIFEFLLQDEPAENCFATQAKMI